MVVNAVIAIVIGYLLGSIPSAYIAARLVKGRDIRQLGTAVGVMAILLFLYGYWQQLVIFSSVIVVPLLVTRNIALSVLGGLLALPIIIWLGTKSALFTILAAIIFVMIWLKFLPTVRTAWTGARNKRDFFFAKPLRTRQDK